MLYQPALNVPAILPPFHLMVVSRCSPGAEPRLVQVVFRGNREDILVERAEYVKRRVLMGWDSDPFNVDDRLCSRPSADDPTKYELLFINIGDSMDPPGYWDVQLPRELMSVAG